MTNFLHRAHGVKVLQLQQQEISRHTAAISKQTRRHSFRDNTILMYNRISQYSVLHVLSVFQQTPTHVRLLKFPKIKTSWPSTKHNKNCHCCIARLTTAAVQDDKFVSMQIAKPLTKKEAFLQPCCCIPLSTNPLLTSAASCDLSLFLLQR